jgi:phosphotransferase system enzyme I (PtsI)
MSEPTLDETIIKGINASPGICIGKAYIVDKEGVDVVEKYYIPGKKSRQSEIKRFKAAVKKAKDELRSIIESSPEEFQHAHILETHMALLKDKSLYGKTLKTINPANH